MSSLVSDPRFAFSPAAQTGATAAVIEDARRRQRRRRLLGTLAGVALAVTAGVVSLGLRHSGQTNGAPVATRGRVASPHPSVTLYLRRDTSPSEIRNTISSLRHEYGIARVTFVSRQAALRTMKQRYPKLLSSLTFNPLADAIDVRLTTERARPSIVSQLRQLPIVEHISSRAPNN
jgi:cell division protein FtsX